VQHDCRSAHDDAGFQARLATYGSLAAQIVTPVVSGGRLVAIVSVHQLGAPRRWSPEDVEAATAAARRIGELL
jgi:GAF domain-containing protein